MSIFNRRLLRHPLTHSLIGCCSITLWFALTPTPAVENTALNKPSPSGDARIKPLPKYRSEMRTVSSESLTLTRYARTEPVRDWTLLNRIGATVAEIAVEEGNQVKQGDLLIRLSDADLISEKEALQLALNDAQSEFDALSELVEKGAASRRSVEQAQQALSRAQAEWDQFNEGLSHYQITAPADGYIQHINTEVGAYISANTTVIDMSDIDQVKVVVAVPEAYLKWLRIGQNARFTSPVGDMVFSLSRIHKQGYDHAPLFDIELTSLNNPAGISGQSGTLQLPYRTIFGIRISPFTLVIHEGELGVKVIDTETRTVVFIPTQIMQTFEDNTVLVELPYSEGNVVELITLGAEEMPPGTRLPIEDSAS